MVERRRGERSNGRDAVSGVLDDSFGQDGGFVALALARNRGRRFAAFSERESCPSRKRVVRGVLLLCVGVAGIFRRRGERSC